MNEDDDNMMVDLYDLGWNDGAHQRPVDQDYYASEEYMAGYHQGSSANSEQ